MSNPHIGKALELMLGVPKDGDVWQVADVGPGGDCAATDGFVSIGCEVDRWDPKGARREWGSPVRFVEDFFSSSRVSTWSYDAIWASHVMEHVFELPAFLSTVWRALRPGGWFFCTVPPDKAEIVGGHVNHWRNLGALWYTLLRGGIYLPTSKSKREGYNLSCFCRKPGAGEPQRDPFFFLLQLKHDAGDIEKLRELDCWPKGFLAHQGFNGDIEEWNW